MMLKATKTIVMLMAVPLLWLGGTAYISSNTETYLDKYVENNNKLYEQYGMEMSIETFEKGFFSSSAKVSIDFVEPEYKKIVSQTLKLPILIAYNIENGPLFFQNGLGMGTSRISNSINLSEHMVDKDAFKKVFKEDIKFISSTSIDFFQNASFSAKSTNIVANLEDKEVHISPLKVEGDMNLNTFEGNMKVSVDSITTTDEKDSVILKSLVLDADITKFYDNGFYLGDFVLKVGSLSAKGDVLPFELDGAKITLAMNIDENKDKTIDMKFKLAADVGDSTLPKEYTSLNNVELNYALNGTKLEGLLAFQDFTKNIEQKEKEVLAKLTSASNGALNMEALAELEKLQIQTQEELMLVLVGLLKKDSTNFTFETKMVDKNAKESIIKLNIAYVGEDVLPSSAKELEEKFSKDFLNLLTLDLNVDLDKKYIANLPEQLQQELGAQLQMGMMFGIVKDNNTSYTFDVNYKAKTLMVNGKNRSEILELL